MPLNPTIGCTIITPGVNFNNLLQAAFAHLYPKNIKNTVKSPVTFYAFGICESVKAVRIMLMKLSPGVKIINVYMYGFFVRMSFWHLFLVTFWLWQKICTKNARVDEIDSWSQSYERNSLEF